LTRERYRAPRGRQVYRAISGMRYARETFIGAHRKEEILVPFCYRGTCNNPLLNIWVKDFLLAELKPGQVVVMDSAVFDKFQQQKNL